MQTAYVRKETAISMVINAVISAGFVWAAFGGSPMAPVWGPGGVAFDFVPQTFMVTLMGVLVPTLLTRQRVRSGAIQAIHLPSARLPRNAAVRAVSIAVLVTAILAGLAAAILALSGIDRLAFGLLALIKVAYGALVAALVTPLAVKAALGDGVLARP